MITKDMTVGEIAYKYPEAADVMLKYGLHCVGCGVSGMETVEEGALGHGMSGKEVDTMVKEMVAAVKDNAGTVINLTDNAAERIKSLLKNRQGYGLRIKVIEGGCSGKKYSFSFDNKSDNSEVIEASGINIFIDGESLPLIRGSKIDFINTSNGSGFKVSNPNAKGSCGCGESFQ